MNDQPSVMDPQQQLAETGDSMQSLDIKDESMEQSAVVDSFNKQDSKGDVDDVNGNDVNLNNEETVVKEQNDHPPETAVNLTESSAELAADDSQSHHLPEITEDDSTVENQTKTGSKKGKRLKKVKEDDGIHRVTLTVTIAKAIPTGKTICVNFVLLIS